MGSEVSPLIMHELVFISDFTYLLERVRERVQRGKPQSGEGLQRAAWGVQESGGSVGGSWPPRRQIRGGSRGAGEAWAT